MFDKKILILQKLAVTKKQKVQSLFCKDYNQKCKESQRILWKVYNCWFYHEKLLVYTNPQRFMNWPDIL